jgi:hypothetical protein
VDTYQGVCVDVVDLGIETPKNPQYRPAHKIRVVWQLNETITKAMVLAAKKAAGDNSGTLSDVEKKLIGQRLLISQKYTLSLHEKAHLRKDLKALRGEDFAADELDEGFDVESMIGMNANINVIHNTGSDGKVYANIASLAPWKTKFGPPMEADENYTRVVDRKDNGGESSADDSGDDEDEDDIPFKETAASTKSKSPSKRKAA